MSGKWTITIAFIITLVLWGVVTAGAGPPAQSPQAVAEPLGTGFTYQGQLKLDGQPVDDVCNLQFSLYEDALGQTQVGSSQTVADVGVTGGLFTVQLDFGADPFRGDARWLGVQVRCTGDAEYADLGIQALTATPYALYALAAPWDGLTDMPAGFADGVDDVAAVVSGTTIYAGEGLTRVDSGATITLSLASTYRLPQTCAGGQIAEWDGAAWVCGDDDSGGSGGEGDITAVYPGEGLSGGGASGPVTLTVDFGGDGSATTAARSDHDHWGESWSGSGTGLTLDSNDGDDLRLSGATGEIVADSQSYSDLAFHSNDNVDVHLDDDSNSSNSAFNVLDSENAALLTVGQDGTISWSQRTGYVSVSAAAFRPAYDGYNFHNAGLRLDNVDGASDFYFAPVQLPHGATVTRLSFYYDDDSASGDGVAELRVNDMDGTFRQMAYVVTVTGQSSGYDDTINYATVDNSQYAYYLQCNLDDSDVYAYGVIIEYTYTEPH